MSKLKVLGILLLVYGLFCIMLGIFKFPFFWSWGNIQSFINILGELGTQVFIIIWGLIILGFGMWLTFIREKKLRNEN